VYMKDSMKGVIFIALLGAYFFLFYYYFSNRNSKDVFMKNPPKKVGTYNEIAIRYNENVVNHYNELSLEEKIFCYYMWRASLPGNRIAADQIHRNSLEVLDVFTIICKGLKFFNGELSFSKDEFIKQIKTFLVYLWTNHGQYFQREHNNEKRTPHKLGLDLLTKKNVVNILEKLGKNFLVKKVDDLEKIIFDETYEPTCTVPNDIEKSACNFYSPDFTEQHYEMLSSSDRKKVNVYFSILDEKTVMLPYAIGKKYGQELEVSVFWIKKAKELVFETPKKFDQHMMKSLEYLVLFLETGNEDYFKKHSIEWLKSNSRVDYNFGFIETYQDPKSMRGSFQAEVTIKCLNIDKLNQKLPEIEKSMPLPSEFKKEKLDAIPNASINYKIFGSGGLGPLNNTAAYCLPNYEEIRSQYGSKQIIYPADESLEQKLNPDLSRRLFNFQEDALWLVKNDPEGKLAREIWNVQCILHETIGHGSGRLAIHVFKEGNFLTIHGKNFVVGDEIQVTSDNIGELLQGYEHAIEEMRAEIIALYVSVHHLKELQECNMLDEWSSLLDNEELEKKLIVGMASTGLRRLLQQSDNAKEVSGDHARANYTILNYLLDHGGLLLEEEEITIKEKNYTVLGLVVDDLKKTKNAIKKLMIEIQRIKSTGDGAGAEKLIKKYGIVFRDENHIKILKENRKLIVGNIKCSATIYPHFIPIYDGKSNITAIKVKWPKDIFEQYEWYKDIEMSKK
jgi:dipeptidyl-peptidase III